MNILIIGSDYKPLSGGIAEYTHQLANQLDKHGNNVTVLTQGMPGDASFDAKIPYGIHRTDFSSILKGKITKYQKGYRWLYHFINNHGPVDIVISNCRETMSLIAVNVAKSLKIPFAIFTHGLEINRKEIKEKLKTKYILRQAKKVFCNSTFTRELVLKHGVLFVNTAIIPGGVSIKHFMISNDTIRNFIKKNPGFKRKKILFTCGRIVRRKGHSLVIEILPRILKEFPETVYVIAGDGPYENELRNIVRQKDLENNVIFKGKVDDETRNLLYTICNIFVMPCRVLESGDVEGFGIVFLEANACGKPVIAGKSGGTSDAVVHNQTGFLVDPLDHQQLAHTITYLFSNPDIAMKIGQEGRKRVSQKFTWEIIGANLHHVLSSICKVTSNSQSLG